MSTLTTRRRKPITLSPKDHGRKMSLALFDRALAADGRVYELNKGVIEVSEIPGRVHRLVEAEVRRIFTAYELANPDVIQYQGNGATSKMIIDAYESERHPDWAVYLTPMPQDDHPWSIWKPTLVVEVVSETSIKRDYEDKPQEYLALGVFQYWILDPIKSSMLVKTNKGGLWQDKAYKPGQKVSCPLLPKFSFDLRRALNAAK